MNGDQKRGIEFAYSWTESGYDGAGTRVSVTVGVTWDDRIVVRLENGEPAVMDADLGTRVSQHMLDSVLDVARRQFPTGRQS